VNGRLFARGRVILALIALFGAIDVEPASAASGRRSADVRRIPRISATAAIPGLLTADDQAIYRDAFELVRRGRGRQAIERARQARSDLLLGAVQGEAYLDQRPSFATLAEWLACCADHPQALTLYPRAQAARPADVELPPLPPAAPRPMAVRERQRPAAEVPEDARARGRDLLSRVRQAVSANDPRQAERAFNAMADGADPAAAGQAAYRLAWDYYQDGDDASALRIGQAGSRFEAGDAAQAAWVAGLAAYRLDDCDAAARAFDAMAGKADVDNALRAAGLFWAARSHVLCGRPANASPRLREAARLSETFYGLLANRMLGIEPALDWGKPEFIAADWNLLSAIPAIRRAVALTRIGELGLADRELRLAWDRAEETHFDAIVRLAAALDLPATQRALALRPPRGQSPPVSARFPMPDWLPYGGWRIEKALAFAVTLQESGFVTAAVSRAGARGLMQLMPATAQATATRTGLIVPEGGMGDPVYNLELGQAYLETLRDLPLTGGALFKVIAAYNAGPGSVQAWNATLKDKGDALLFLESIPFAETRAYVETVVRNYWLYQLRGRQPMPALDATAANKWPEFPGLDRLRAAPVPVAPPPGS